MRILNSEQMKEIDNKTIKDVGIPGIVLMENAAIVVVDELIKDLGVVYNKNIMIFAGKGNNGGDAFAVARHLKEKGANVLVILLAKIDEVSGDARTNLNIVQNIGVNVVEFIDESNIDKIRESLYVTDAVVDGIFGIGLDRDVEGIIRDVIEIINNFARYIISIDVPSGLDSTTGKVMGVCVRADKTVTFGFIKAGMVVAPGAFYCGNIVISDTGFYYKTLDFEDGNMHLLEKNMVASSFGIRRPDTHKGDYGKLLVLAGSFGMTGAAVLCSRAAMRTGAGLVYVGALEKIANVLEQKIVEEIVVSFEDDEGSFDASKLIHMLSNVNAVIIGPGLALDDDTVKITETIVAESKVPVVLDAQALNVLAKDINILSAAKAPIIITPHPGEMATLLNTESDTIQDDRIKIIREFSKKWGIITVLKGYRTVISDVDGTVYINPTGNAGMATAGSGDILAGIIGALLARGVEPINAANSAVYVHGLAGDLVAAQKGEHGMISSDIVGALPKAIVTLNSN